MRNRKNRVDLRLSDDEYAKLQQLAEDSGYTVSGVIRAMIAGYQLQERPTKVLQDFNRQMLQIGINLNQIAAKANSLGLLDAGYYRQQAEDWNELRLQIYEKLLLPRKEG